MNESLFSIINASAMQHCTGRAGVAKDRTPVSDPDSTASINTHKNIAVSFFMMKPPVLLAPFINGVAAGAFFRRTEVCPVYRNAIAYATTAINTPPMATAARGLIWFMGESVSCSVDMNFPGLSGR